MTTVAIVIPGDPIPSVARFAGSFSDMVQRAIGPRTGLCFRTIDARTEALPHPDEVEGIIITGSAHSVFERLPWMLRLESFVRDCVAARRHILGICFGHQLIASALYGEVVRNPNGRETGRVTAQILTHDDPLGFPKEAFSVLMVHRDTVARLPENSVPLARTGRDAHAAVRFNPRCWGVQYHPEFSPEVVHEYIKLQRSALVAQGDDPDAIAADLEATPYAGGILRAFIQLLDAPGPSRGPSELKNTSDNAHGLWGK